MSEFNPPHPATFDEPETPQTTPGATGVFGVLAPHPAALNPAAEPPAAAPEIWPRPASLSAAPATPFPARPASTPVVVHEVKFQAQDAEGSEAESSLQRLLQSLGPVGEAPTQAAGAGGFTQLLSALQIPPAPAPIPGPPAPPPLPVQAAIPPPAAFEPHPVSVPAPPEQSPASPGSALDPSSFTQLFEALAPPSAGPSTGVPSTAASFTTPAPARVPEPHVPATSIPSSAGDPAGFTQLFNALGAETRPEASQAADYPPLVARKPSFAPPPAAPSASFSGDLWQPGVPSPASPPSPAHSDNGSDLHSLTQLLQALEYPPTQPAHGGPAPVFPGRDARRGAGISGATVAFTPPESVQRRAGQPPAAVSGPGDFTRVLQASALRESGLGSQAAAAQQPPAAPAPASAPPAHGAAVPLPPWVAPPMPYAPHLSSLAHANGSVPGLGPAPGMHAPMHPQMQGPHLGMPSAFMAPGPFPQGAQGTPGKASARGALLPLILMAIIVILVGILVAVLLRH